MEYRLQKRLDTGIDIVGSVLSQTLGTVPEFECREAAVYVHMPWSEWEDPATTTEARAFAVAHYRMHMAVDAHVADAQQKHMDKERAKNSSVPKRGTRRG